MRILYIQDGKGVCFHTLFYSPHPKSRIGVMKFKENFLVCIGQSRDFNET